jgi:hypothetical protein
MKRTTFALVFAAATAAAVTAATLPGCTASVESGCLGGPCDDDAGVMPKVDGGGMCTGQPGGPACYADFHAVMKCDPSKMPTDGDIPCDVWAVMHKQPLDSGGCHKCHQDPPLNGAPFPEITYQDLLVKTSTFGYGMGGDERIFQSMMYALAANLPCGPTGYTPMPFVTSEPLMCQDSLTLSNWLAACIPPAPAGTGGAACCKKFHDDADPDAGCP